MSEGTIV